MENENHRSIRVLDIDYDKLEWKEPGYYIGVDMGADHNEPAAYCLLLKVGDETTVLLSKSNIDKKSFQEEIDNLAKYFNAKVIEQKYGK